MTQTTVKIAVVTTHIAPASGFGGVAEAIGRIVRAWAAAGHDFHVCSSDGSHGPALRPGDVGLPARSPVRLYRAQGWPRFGFGLGAVAAIYRVCRDADAVYVNGIATWPTTLAALICAGLGRPMVVALRAGLMAPHLAVIRARKPHKWLFYRLLTLPGLRRAAGLHLTSSLEAAGLSALVPGVALEIIANGLDLGEWPAQPPRPADGGLTLGYVGRLSPEKGILRFLQVWRTVRRAGDRLVIAGSGEGAYAQAVAAEAAALGGAVELVGTIDRAGVQALLARCDGLVLPSGIEQGDLRENFGNAAAEALASARLLLVTRGLAWDDAEPHGFGLLFDADPASIAAAIGQAQAQSPAQRAAMGAAGRAWAERSVDIRVTAERLWHCLATAAAKRG
jgi:glycosyltransferase involved in cell wall biosynthesis